MGQEHFATTSKIFPFPPRSFPPCSLKKKTFSALLKRANRAITEYGAILAQIPFPISHLSVLMQCEAINSLDAQQGKVSLKDLLYAEASALKKKKNLDPVLHYQQALKGSLQKGPTPMTHEMICTLHKKIKYGTGSKAEIGTYRKKQNWIGPRGCTIEEAYFYPPAPKCVRAMMTRLLRYANSQQKEPLLHLALFFAQLLIIHPFMDGNGRIARILISYFLHQKKLTPFLFMSRYFWRHRLLYFFNLYKTTEENQWEPWVIFFMKGVITEANRFNRLIKKIMTLYGELQNETLFEKRVIHFLFQKPIFRSPAFKKAGGSKKVLTQLEKLKWIKRDREHFYLFTPLLKILQGQ
jgi:Fic family protein